MIKAIVTLAMSIFVLSTPILNIAIMEYWLNLGVATLIAQIGILALWIYFTKINKKYLTQRKHNDIL